MAPARQNAKSPHSPASLIRKWVIFQPHSHANWLMGIIRKSATEHRQPFELTEQKEYEVPMLDEQAYIMQVGEVCNLQLNP
jgi:hypothetical protein